MMKRNFLSLLVLVMSSILLFSACGTQSANGTGSTTAGTTAAAQETAAPTTETTAAAPAPEEKITLQFEQFSGSGDNETYLKNMIAEYNKVHPNVTVELQTIAYGDYFTQMMAKVSAGQAPDLYELNYENFVSYAKKGVLLSLDELIQSTGTDIKNYNEMALNAFKADGKQYGVPNSFSDVLLFYNRDLFDKAQVAYPTNDWTWKDVLAAAEKIRAVDKNTFGYYRPVSFHELYKGVKQNGGSLFNDDMTQFTMNDPKTVETVQYLADMITKYNVMPTEAQLAGMGDWDLFKAGRLGMIVTGVWAIPDFTKNCSFTWDIAVEPGNTQKATHFFSNGYVLNKDTKYAPKALELAVFLSSAKEAVNIRLDAGWELPPVTDPAVIDKYKSITPPANRQAVFDSLQYLVTPPVIEQFTEFQDIVKKHLDTVITKKATAQAAMDACQKELEEKIKLK